MQISTHEAEVLRLVGFDLFRRAVGYARDGSVTGVQITDDGDTLRAQVRGRDPRPYTTQVYLTREPGLGVVDFLGVCTCPVRADCKHAVALMIADADGPDPQRTAPAWRTAFDALLPDRGVAEQPPVALQFDRCDDSVTIRPVVPGVKGGWVRTGISWTDLDRLRWSRSPRANTAHRLLAELSALYTVAQSDEGYYYGRPAVLAISDFSRRVWDVLVEAQTGGMPFVSARVSDGPVLLHDQPVTIALDVRSDTEISGAVVEPRISLGDTALPAEAVLFLGAPAHGVAWADGSGQHLARLDAPGLDVRELLNLGPVRVPPDEVDRFLGSYALPLQNAVPLVSSDDSICLPELGRPTLVLAVTYESSRLRLGWSWRYGSGRFEFVVPLGADAGAGRLRDRASEQAIADAALAACAGRPELLSGARIAAAATLTGAALIAFAEQVRPALELVPGVCVEAHGDELDVHEAVAAPEIDFVVADADEGPAGRDWLDLDVSVRVDGEAVPFAELFRALAAGERVLILPSGTWLRLDRPEFAQLADLIAESCALYDAESESVRVGRYQAGVWDDLERLGTVRGQAAGWERSMRALLAASAATAPELTPVPAGLNATLRPYQQIGFSWLAHLFDHGLGGVLADEMGLGKTIQCLALFCRARAQAPGAPPFLVVAPTSVVSNWANEAARFAPGLRVVAITASTRRRGRGLTDLVDGADVVITSYALFRIDHHEYDAVGWSGLVLDEAQFVKNHRSQTFACAKKLAAPFKLAITGTPMENNLTELWAIFAVAAPGLFPNPKAFEQYYRTPIERGRNTELLGQLRRRIRPFLLRRTKAEVAADLPAKQEQVLELDLDPRHRKAYQTLLARERRKVLGLLGDLDRNQFEILRSLTLLRQASLDVSLVDPKQHSVPSTKLDELMRMLAEIAAEGHRVIVFSQFTRFLEKVRGRLEHTGIAHCYLDGRTRNRADVIDGFKTGDAPVFLISLKAGGFGLNLTEADYCILLDPWWNAAAEAQAVDRVHRIGQTRTVNVYRLVARDTIEAKVMAVKQGKAELVAGVLDGGDWAGSRLTVDEIRDLLS